MNRDRMYRLDVINRERENVTKFQKRKKRIEKNSISSFEEEEERGK